MRLPSSFILIRLAVAVEILDGECTRRSKRNGPNYGIRPYLWTKVQIANAGVKEVKFVPGDAGDARCQASGSVVPLFTFPLYCIRSSARLVSIFGSRLITDPEPNPEESFLLELSTIGHPDSLRHLSICLKYLLFPSFGQ